MKYRPYQNSAINAGISEIKKCIDPILLDLATGAGKSFIVTGIAKWMTENTDKRVLCLAPSKELTEQNYEKYLMTGEKASIFSASVGSKCLRHTVVFGTPQTVKNCLKSFGDKFGLIVIDEAHKITNTIKAICKHIKEKNPNLRIVGMTATPYRLGSGYIYEIDENGEPVSATIDPFFKKLVYKIHTKELIDMGYLSPVVTDDDNEKECYQAAHLKLNKMGQFDSNEIEKTFVGQGRKTAMIVQDIVRKSAGRQGVMIFAATVQHAKEILESLPEGISAMCAGEYNTKTKEREKVVNDFKAKKIKYLVNVGMFTTGFDAPHVDVVAILRATESAALLQQIIGRGLRLDDQKTNCLLLDYAENVERHDLQNDLFSPKIEIKRASEESEELKAICEHCNTTNHFKKRINDSNLGIDDNGYFLDALGNRIETDYGFMPAHFGRRCLGQKLIAGNYQRCEYRWTIKTCPECQHQNDIAARYCEKCKAEIVNPNDKLKEYHAKIKKDPYSVSSDKVLNWSYARSISANGNDTIVIEYKTEYRKFKVWFVPQSRAKEAITAWQSLCKTLFGRVLDTANDFMNEIENRTGKIETVTCYRKSGTNFYSILAHNEPVTGEEQESA